SLAVVVPHALAATTGSRAPARTPAVGVLSGRRSARSSLVPRGGPLSTAIGRNLFPYPPQHKEMGGHAIRGGVAGDDAARALPPGKRRLSIRQPSHNWTRPRASMPSSTRC